MFLLLTKHEVCALWHLNDLLLVGDHHHEGVLAEVGNEHRDDTLGSPLRRLLLRGLKLKPEWMEYE